MKDSLLESRVIQYNQSRLKAFRSGVEFIKNNEYERILSSRYMKVSRIKKHLVCMVSHRRYSYFITFTFDDNYINKCQRTKRDLIKSSLNSFSSDILYILNIDYGKKTEREHFHAIVSTDNSSDLSNHLKLTYPCFTKCEYIRLESDDIKRLSKYINKLTNHCCKDSTYNKRIVYNFKGYDVWPAPLNRYMFLLDSYNLGL